MQWIVPVGVVIFFLLLTCGCIQAPPAPVTPVPQVAVPPPGNMAPAPVPLRDVNISATKEDPDVVVLVSGGKDALGLASMDIRITNYDGTIDTRTIAPVIVGKPYIFTYRGNANAARVNIIGTFSDGYQQTLLMTPV